MQQANRLVNDFIQLEFIANEPVALLCFDSRHIYKGAEESNRGLGERD